MSIAQLNDHFRQTFIGGKVVLTSSVAEMEDIKRAALLNEVMLYDQFTEENDPYKEHDFGNILFDNRIVFWKIDYYNKTMDAGSEDPSNLGITTRVLTVMLAEEY